MYEYVSVLIYDLYWVMSFCSLIKILVRCRKNKIMDKNTLIFRYTVFKPKNSILVHDVPIQLSFLF